MTVQEKLEVLEDILAHEHVQEDKYGMVNKESTTSARQCPLF